MELIHSLKIGKNKLFLLYLKKNFSDIYRRSNQVSEETIVYKEAMKMLKQTSRTFYIPINLLGSTLKKTVGSAYLCMRAIDEIEDDETLDAVVKEKLLRSTSDLLKQPKFNNIAYLELIKPYEHILPEVTIRLGDWLLVCPEGIAEKVKDSTATMANGMADWVRKDWDIKTTEDLNDYTYYVAGLVGVMLSDIWNWYDGTETDRDLAIGYGKGLQAVNILRNQHEDYAERGVRFIPDGWDRDDMFAYADTNLKLADEYMKDIKNKKILLFCKIPLALAKKTLKAMQDGREKISRTEVEEIVDDIQQDE